MHETDSFGILEFKGFKCHWIYIFAVQILQVWPRWWDFISEDYCARILLCEKGNEWPYIQDILAVPKINGIVGELPDGKFPALQEKMAFFLSGQECIWNLQDAAQDQITMYHTCCIYCSLQMKITINFEHKLHLPLLKTFQRLQVPTRNCSP